MVLLVQVRQHRLVSSSQDETCVCIQAGSSSDQPVHRNGRSYIARRDDRAIVSALHRALPCIRLQRTLKLANIAAHHNFFFEVAVHPPTLLFLVSCLPSNLGQVMLCAWPALVMHVSRRCLAVWREHVTKAVSGIARLQICVIKKSGLKNLAKKSGLNFRHFWPKFLA